MSERAQARAARLGLLTPFKELPGEYSDLVAAAPRPMVAWQVITDAQDSHTPDDLRAMGAVEPLADGIRRLRRWRPDALMWACTSGSFIVGRAGSIAQSRELSRLAGVPARSTSLAFVSAIWALGVDDVAVLSPYPDEATAAFVAYLAEWGVGVTDVVALGHAGATSSEQIEAGDVAAAVEALSGAAHVLIPDTATWGFELWEQLQARSRHTIVTANQATLWLASSLLGIAATDPRYGVLRGLVAEDPLDDAA